MSFGKNNLPFRFSQTPKGFGEVYLEGGLVENLRFLSGIVKNKEGVR